MTVLVTYASKHGSTAEIAQAVARGLRDAAYADELLQPERKALGMWRVEPVNRVPSRRSLGLVLRGMWRASSTAR